MTIRSLWLAVAAVAAFAGAVLVGLAAGVGLVVLLKDRS